MIRRRYEEKRSVFNEQLNAFQQVGMRRKYRERRSLVFSTSKFVKNEDHIGILKRSKLETNDLLISIAGTLGRSAVVEEKYLPLNTN